MKKSKLLSLLLTAAVSASLISMPITANAADYDLTYDMDTNYFPSSWIQNSVMQDDGLKNSALTTDPLNASNKVWRTKAVSTGNGRINLDLDLPQNGEKYIQAEFDVYMAALGKFYAQIYQNRGFTNGKTALYMKNDGGVDCATVGGGATYEAGKWYSFKIVLDYQNTKYMLWMKEKGKDEYRYLAEYPATGQTFTGYRLSFMAEDTYAYLDNVKFSALNSYDKSIHYEFNDVQTKTNKPYLNWGANCGSTIWSQATFDGAQVLKGAVNATSAMQPYTADRIPDMDKVVIETRLGYDGENTENPNKYLPLQFGIIPVFSDANGNKNAGGTSERTEGIKFESSRYIKVEGKSYNKNAGVETVKGYNLANGKLYTAGYVYDRLNKVFKAYFITNNGETLVQDVSTNTYVQAQRNLAGVQLWLRAEGTQLVCNGYYDYLRIDEPETFEKTALTLGGTKENMSLMPQIKIDYNNIIDPTALSSATAYFAPKNASGDTGRVNAALSTYNGRTLTVTPSSALDASTEYVMTVSGIKDLLGQSAAAVTEEFTTGKLINSSAVTLAGGSLVDGSNTAKVTLNSNDGQSHDAVLIAAVYDKTTDRFISAARSDKQTITTKAGEYTVAFDTTGRSNYKVKVFVWSGLSTLIPYVDNVAEFSK